MDHFDIKVSEVNEPARLSAVEHLGLSEVGEVLVISENLHGERRAMEVMAPGFQGADDGKEFTVIDVTVSFCRGERLGEIGTWVPVPVGVCLEEDSTRCILGSVGGNGERGEEVGEVKYGF